MVHVPGRKHAGPDATSQSPVSKGKHLDLAFLTALKPEQEVVTTTVRHLVASLRQAPTQEEQEEALLQEQRALEEAYSCLAALTLTAGQEEDLQPACPGQEALQAGGGAQGTHQDTRSSQQWTGGAGAEPVWQPEMRSGSDFRRMLQILSKWCKRSENAPNVRTSELDHISGSFLACGQVVPE